MGSTMAYFMIMQGLRGCYMPDSNCVISAASRRELKRALQWEAGAQGAAFATGNLALWPGTGGAALFN